MSITKHLKIPSSAITGNCITSTIRLLPRSYYNMMKHHSSVLARTLRICSKLYIYPFVVGRGHSMFDVRSQPRKKNVNWRDSSPPSIATSALHYFFGTDKSVPQLLPHIAAVLHWQTHVRGYLPPGVPSHLCIFIIFQ